MIVDKIDNLTMFRRELCQALPQNDARVLFLHRDFWIVTGILCAAGFALYYRYFVDGFLPARR